MKGLDISPSVDEEMLVAEIESDGDGCDRDNYAREVSVARSPLFIDNDRSPGAADHDRQSQGGPGESKHFKVAVDKTIRPEVTDNSVPSMRHISPFRSERLTELNSFRQISLSGHQ